MNTDLIGELLRQKLEQQPLVKKYANTVTTAVGALIAVVWTLVSAGIEVPDQLSQGVLVLISLLTVVGVKLTPNGVTEKQVEELTDYVGKHRAS